MKLEDGKKFTAWLEASSLSEHPLLIQFEVVQHNERGFENGEITLRVVRYEKKYSKCKECGGNGYKHRAPEKLSED